MPIKEQPSETSRAWVGFNLPPIMSEYFRRMQRRIKRSDVIKFETDSHITVRWGLDPRIEPYRVQDALDNRLRATMRFVGVEIFDNQNQDVLVAKVESIELPLMWRSLKLPNTVTTHPVYVPHVTIAYLRRGRGKLYEGFDLGIAPRRKFLLTNLLYNQPAFAGREAQTTYIGN